MAYGGKAVGAIAALIASIMATSALAQTIEIESTPNTAPAAQPLSKDWAWTFGLGAGIIPDYEGSDDYILVPVPYVRAQKEYVFGQLLGLHLTSNVLNGPNWRLGPSLNRRRGYNDSLFVSIEDDRVDRLKDREASWEIGLKAGYDFDFRQAPLPSSTLSLAAELLADVSGGHDGYVVTPSVTYRALLSERLTANVGAQFSWASKDYMRHYFRISGADALDSGLAPSDADADVKDYAFTLGFGYALSERWGINLLGQYKRMVGDAADSPIVKDRGNEDQFLGGFWVSYAW